MVVAESPEGGLHGDPQFIKVGLGNIDQIPIIEDGDIQQYPVMAYASKGLKCVDAQKISDDQVKIESKLYAPMRKDDPSQNYQELTFETLITFDKKEGLVDF